jgi:deoxyribodipyrimidine photo-lyase
VSGCGADAAPYFRIFNPIIQGEKFDPNGDYVRKYVPELEGLPNKFIHKPWEASPEVLQEANVKLGKSYPHPIVDLRESRDKALFEFKRLST